jgi:hypothetical protein
MQTSPHDLVKMSFENGMHGDRLRNGFWVTAGPHTKPSPYGGPLWELVISYHMMWNYQSYFKINFGFIYSNFKTSLSYIKTSLFCMYEIIINAI